MLCGVLKESIVPVSIKQMITGCVAAALVAAAPLAHAAPWGDRLLRDGAKQGNRQEQQSADQRDVQRSMRQSGRGDEQRPQRLSLEERRQLRRDIQDAGREIYPPRR